MMKPGMQFLLLAAMVKLVLQEHCTLRLPKFEHTCSHPPFLYSKEHGFKAVVVVVVGCLWWVWCGVVIVVVGGGVVIVVAVVVGGGVVSGK